MRFVWKASVAGGDFVLRWMTAAGEGRPSNLFTNSDVWLLASRLATIGCARSPGLEAAQQCRSGVGAAWRGRAPGREFKIAARADLGSAHSQPGELGFAPRTAIKDKLKASGDGPDGTARRVRCSIFSFRR